MKRSNQLALAILIVGAVPALVQHQRLVELRQECRQLVADAARLGWSDPDAVEPHLTRMRREPATPHAGALADEILSVADAMEDMRNRGLGTDEALKNRGMEITSRLMALDSAAFRKVITVLREQPGIPDDRRRSLIGTAILRRSEDRPEEAVELYMEASDLLHDTTVGDRVITSALSRWAEQSPEAARSWILAQAPAHPDLVDDQAKRAVIAGTAVNDPELAFKLIDGLHAGDKATAIQAILASGEDAPARWDVVLSALRGHLATIQDEGERGTLRDKALESFAGQLGAGGFDTSVAWMETAGFTAEERQKLAAGLSYFTTGPDTGRWIEWLSSNLTEDSVEGPVTGLMVDWTQQDHQSAGRWLGSVPDGPARTAAVRAYATAVAQVDPAVAAQWAMTLPAGPDRDATLRLIHRNWPASDPDGAAAFAREHGLK